MTSALRSAWFVLVAALHVGFVPAQARAADAAAEVRVPTSAEVERALAGGLAKLPDALRERFAAVVAAAHERLRAGLVAEKSGSGPAIGIEEAARAAVVAADFGGAATSEKKRDAMVRITVLQITLDMQTALRELAGLRLAVRAVKSCKGQLACLDRIAPTAEMSARQVMAVRAEIGNDVAALATAEIAIGEELDVLRKRGLDNLQKLLDIIRTMNPVVAK
jgi:hypothetical protein